MKTLSLMETKAVSGGDFIIDGLLYSVPSWGIPAGYYNQIDTLFCLYLSNNISENKFFVQLSMLPHVYVSQYADNLDYMTISWA